METTAKKGLEIERKYLIVYPDEARLAAMDGARVSDIVQTYLLPDGGERRVRRWTERGEVVFLFTRKGRRKGLSRMEEEYEITEETYRSLLREADPAKYPLHKRRYTIPYGAHTAEIDVYPFMRDRAILEIELRDEDEAVTLPDFVTVIREVTGEREYKNPVLASKRSDAF